MAIDARAEEAGVAVGVVRGGGLEMVDDFGFAHLARDIQIARQAVFLGNDGKEVVDGRGADLAEHRRAFGVGFG